jgi:hypothetical protein
METTTTLVNAPPPPTLEHARFIASMCASEVAVQEGQVQDLDQAFTEIWSELGL